MAKLNLSDITEASGFSTTVNANNALIETAIENTLSRDGTSPNFHDSTLDMNSNQINNLADGTALQDAVTVNQLTNAELAVSTNQASVIIVQDTNNNYTNNNVEDVLTEIASNDFTGYSITSDTLAIASGVMAIDYSLGNAYEVELTENVTSVTISNSPTSGRYGEIVIKFIQDSTGSRTVAGWPAGVKWSGGGTAPTITTTLTTGTDIVVLRTWDAGTTWYGDVSQDYS
jgi:hypothetical protein